MCDTKLSERTLSMEKDRDFTWVLSHQMGWCVLHVCIINVFSLTTCGGDCDIGIEYKWVLSGVCDHRLRTQDLFVQHVSY